MDQKSGKSSSVCFICLKCFDLDSVLETEKDSNFSQHKNSYNHGVFMSETLKNFLQLLTNYLEIPTHHCQYLDLSLLSRKENCSFRVFCENCTQKVNGLHEIYLELLSV
ncbi:unnamed protein product [Orchesella dallaii]|uniref:Uncharacterized protein n=1 Tax=Orchesella dallaii TaxID=48710 RepID=A0ABP1RUG7_9HEXA